MRNALPPLPAELRYPMPGRLYQRYKWLWGVLSLGIPAWLLGLALWDAWPSWGWRQAVLVGLVASQATLYLKTFVFFPTRPLPRWRLIGYFAAGLGVWLIEWQLDTHFRFLHFIYQSLRKAPAFRPEI